MGRGPKAFISYSWEGDAHKEWVRELATRLRGDGIDVTLDQWHVAPGDQLADFMEKSIRENNFIVIICTSRYKERSDRRAGGVGYEGDIMTAEVLTERNNRKFIPVIWQQRWEDSAPSWLKGKYYIDLSSTGGYDELRLTLLGQRPEAPPIGPGSGPASPLAVGGTFQEALERYKRLQEENGLVHVKLHDLTADLDEDVQSLSAKARAGQIDRKQVIKELATKLGEYASSLSPIVSDFHRIRTAVSAAFMEFAATATDSEAATPLLLQDQAKLVRRRKSIARTLLSSIDKPFNTLTSSPRLSQAFNRSRRQAIILLDELRKGLTEEIETVDKSLVELQRLEGLL